MSVLALCLSACEKPKENNGVSSEDKLLVTVNAGVPEIKDAPDDFSPAWTAGETAQLVDIRSNTVYTSLPLSDKDLSDNGTKAAFSFSVPAGSYRMVSPKAEGKVVDGAVAFSVPGQQTQSGAIMSCSRMYAVGGCRTASSVSDIAVSASNTTVQTDLQMTCSVMDFRVFNPVAGSGTEKIQSVKVEAPGIAGTFTASLATAGILTKKGLKDDVTVSLASPADIAASEESAKGIYAVVLPFSQEASEEVSYTVTTDVAIYRVKAADAVSCLSGECLTVTLDLSKASHERPAGLFIIGDATKSETALGLVQGEGNVYEGTVFLTEEGFFFSESNAVDNPEKVWMNDGQGGLVFVGNPSETVCFNLTEGAGDYRIAVDLDARTMSAERVKPLFVSSHPEKNGTFEMEPVAGEPGVYSLSSVWLGGQEYEIRFLAGEGSVYYDPYDESQQWVDDDDRTFVLKNDRSSTGENPFKVMQWGKNFTERYYTIILDTKAGEAKFILETGSQFWLVGGIFGGSGWQAQKFAMENIAGKAVWRGYLAAGEFKMHGDRVWPADPWKGEWYYAVESTDIVSGTTYNVTANADADKKWNITEAGYYTIEFDYSSAPKTVTVTASESLDVKVNGSSMNYDGEKEYSLNMDLRQGDAISVSGFQGLEYLNYDPDFVGGDGRFLATSGKYRVKLHLDAWDYSWMLFQRLDDDGSWGKSHVLYLAGHGPGTVTAADRPEWNINPATAPRMAEIMDGVYTYTGIYKKEWDWGVFHRWGDYCDFKYFENEWWANGTPANVKVTDPLGQMYQAEDGNLKSSGGKWIDGKTYRMTVDTTKEPHEISFEQLD